VAFSRLTVLISCEAHTIKILEKKMAIKYQILCAVKKNLKGKEILVQIGGRNPLGEVWSLKIDQVIVGMKTGDLEFFMNHRGISYPIQLLESDDGIELAALYEGRNLLMELPDCPE
jgi:hypothetical protein